MAGYVIRDLAPRPSNYRATSSLPAEMERQGVVGISGVDTRALTRHLRTAGAMRCGIFSGDAVADLDDLLGQVRAQPPMAGADLTGDVSTPEVYTVAADGEERFSVAAIDLGIKANTPKMLAGRGIRTHVLPATTTIEQIAALGVDGVFLSNGPGDPATADADRRADQGGADQRIPLFGICFGNQILGRALGFGTYKLKFGHRGINQPVRDHGTGRVLVTSHNHGFAVDAPLDAVTDTEFGRAQVAFSCLNDGVVEGLECLDWPAFSVQFHPEAAAGPHDAGYLFDRFVDLHGEVRKGHRLMPRRTDIKHVLVIGSGPIVIGQACEFDYSGTQACRVLRDEGIRVSLINSNPATIMTDPEFADATYIEPINAEFVEKVLADQQTRGYPVDAVLATLGGQTALNTAIALDERGVLEKFGVELIGADIPAINRGEDRQIFKDVVRSVGGDVPRSAVCHTMAEVRTAVAELGLPVVVRPSFTMGGLGSGMAYTLDDLERIAGRGLAASQASFGPVENDGPAKSAGHAAGHTGGNVHASVLIEESVLGWKEYELELMRDGADNAVVVCSIENLDPMGVHTGDSITVAPAMTLTDREYQRMRDLGLAILRAVGVATGGCNIQFAINPANGRIIVIEMNPRVSRSSALASKATGFPIAKIAAKLAIGYTLDEIANDITKATPAAFEPSLDYVVVKIPRFAFEKFPGADPTLTTTMKSVGEAMSIGRSFAEALGKAMRSMETKLAGFWTGPECRARGTWTSCSRS